MSTRLKALCLLVAVALGLIVGLTLLPRHHKTSQLQSPPKSITARLIAQLPTTVNGQKVVNFAMGPGGQVVLVTADDDAFLYGLPGSPSPGLGSGVFVGVGTTGLVAFSGNGQEIAGVTTGATIWEWNPKLNRVWTGEAYGSESGLPFTESAGLALNSTGNLIAINTTGTPYIYRQRGSLLAKRPGNYVSKQVHFVFPAPAFSDNNEYLMEAGNTGIESWSVATGALREVEPECKCGNAVLSTNLSTAVSQRGDFVQAWNLRRNRVAAYWPSEEIQYLAVSSSGNTAAWTTGENSVAVAYTHGSAKPLLLRLYGVAEGGLAFGLNGRLLMAVSRSDTANVWAIGSGEIKFHENAGLASRASQGLRLGRLAGFLVEGSGWGEVKPPTIFNGGDPTGLVSHIRWTSWGGPEAVGTGVSDWVGPGESVATGTQQPVTIVGFNRGPCGGVVMYRAVEWYFPGHDEHFNPKQYENICSGTYVGSP